MDYKCLVVDDDVDIAKTTTEYFNIFDLKTAYVTSSEAALDFIQNNKVSLMLLDINLGDGSGFEVCKKVRKESDIPIFFISARTSDDDVLTALNIGGDDYIKKPYTLNILLAKVKAVLKRYEQLSSSEEKKEERSVNMTCVEITPSVSLDYNYHQLIKNGEPIKLKEMEFKLISYLYENKNRVISKDELFTSVWNDSFVGEGTLTVHIRRIREKIEDIPNEPKYIKTVWGLGYVFETLE